MEANFLRTRDVSDKIIFWDIDGTLAPYRFNNHLADPEGTDNGMSFKEIEEGVFLKRPPSRFMQRVLKTINSKENIILGHFLCDKEIDDKNKWIDINFPEIKTRIFQTDNETKSDKIIDYCQSNGISLKDVIFVDDSLSILRDAERHGIESWHISSFLDFFESNKK